MRKIYVLLSAALCLTAAGIVYTQFRDREELVFAGEREGDEEGYNEAFERDLLELEKIKDPSLGYAPVERLGQAIEFTRQQKSSAAFRSQVVLNWTERGPIYDTVGPSNGNSRAGVNYTSGRIRAVLHDTLNDPTGNTLFAAGVAGGLWKCTNLLSDDIPNWQPVNDYFDNMAICSITQDPTDPRVMYFSTGEPTSNADAVFGGGIWKSTDAGATWTMLPSTSLLRRTFKVLCDAQGNLYVAARTTATPIEQPFGLLRSKNGGQSFQNITPANLTTNTICTDIELSSTGRLHASFGYSTGTVGGLVNHRYTDDPANVTTTGWNSSTGIRSIPAPPVANRFEMAVIGNVVYGITTNGSNNVDSCYKSVDGGATWTRQNNAIYTSGVANTQGWYDLTLAINPSNTDQIMMGGLDAYRSGNSGATVTRATFWVTTAPYVHADHHYMQWWNAEGENRILIAGDGGIFLSRNGGTTWKDRNRNLAIKQFYSAAIHPAAGSPYVIAGSQDNGVHQLKYPGLASSIEVTGGDGAYVHINQLNPQIQFGSYVNSQYRRSTNGGQTWSSANFSGSTGLFINPWDYDDATNTMYASNGVSSAPNHQIRRWPNAHTSGSSTLINIEALRRNNGLANATAFKVSRHTANRVFIGGSTGKLLRWDNANGAVDAASLSANIADIGSPSFPSGFLNCIEVGTSDQFLVAVFTNYGVNNVWYSNNGGSSWTPIDGNLPDMPVRWAVFHPQYNNRIILATEAGVYTTDAVNGANTIWKASSGFPTVRTDMLKLRASDNTLVAATHGRGIFTTVIPTTTVPEINFATEALMVKESSAGMDGCRGYRDYSVDLTILNAPTGAATVTVGAEAGATAVRGVDFDITTNGSFTAPSSEVVFADGVKENKTVMIRIYDDAEVESTEEVALNFAISGTTNAVAGAVDAYAITIGDNDLAPSFLATTRQFKVGVFNSNISTTSPFASNRIRHRMQSLYTAAELSAAGLRPGDPIRSLAINVLEKRSTRPFTGFSVSMGHTMNTSLSAGFANTAYTQVYSGNYTTVAGANEIAFATPFVWDGSSNLVVTFCFDNGAGPVDGAADFVEGNSYPLGAGVRASTYANYTSGTTAGCDLPAAFTSDFRMNLTFGVLYAGNPIATALNTAPTEYLNSQNDLYYYDANGRIVARVRNLSAHNYGCTQVQIDRAGSGATRFWNNNKRNYLADKTYFITPANANAGGRVEVTLYYTRAEKEGWEALTRESWNNILMVKTSGRISDVTPANAQPNNNGTVQDVVVPLRGTYGDGYTLTAVFENGFGGFGAGMPGRQFNSLVNGSSRQIGGEQAMTVIGNPFRDQLRVRFAKVPATMVQMHLYDLSGRRVASQQRPMSSEAMAEMGSLGSLAAGTYLLEVVADGQVFRTKVIRGK